MTSVMSRKLKLFDWSEALMLQSENRQPKADMTRPVSSSSYFFLIYMIIYM